MQNFIVPKKLNTIFLGMAAFGVVSLALGFVLDAPRAWAALLALTFFLLSLTLAGGFFAAIQYVTMSKWSVVIRRVAEVISPAVLPLVGVLMIGVFFGIHHLYHWSHADAVAQDAILQYKSGWLNTPFFIGRVIVYLVLWCFLGRALKSVSVKQDQSKDPAKSKTLIILSTAYLLVFAYSFLLASMDLLMSLEPHWYTTMFPIYAFANMMFLGVGALIIVIYFIKQNGGLPEVNGEHIHDLGKFQFMFTTLWAYIGFSMHMLIWYANLPEETIYLELRVEEPQWFYFTIFLWVFHFVIPFLWQLSAKLKKELPRLVKVSWLIVFMGFVDIVWMTYGGLQTTNLNNAFPFGLLEIGLFIGAMGAYLFLVLNAFSKVNQMPIGDPQLQDSLHFHQTF